MVSGERDGAGDFAWQVADCNGNAEFSERRHDPIVEFRYRLWAQCNSSAGSIGGLNVEDVFNEIELDLETTSLERNEGTRQAARVNVQRDMPAMVQPRR